MATEILSVPENQLLEVIRVIRVGLRATKNCVDVSKETRRRLTEWCDEEEAYLLEGSDDE